MKRNEFFTKITFNVNACYPIDTFYHSATDFDIAKIRLLCNQFQRTLFYAVAVVQYLQAINARDIREKVINFRANVRSLRKCRASKYLH